MSQPSTSSHRLVLIRHGESVWNQQNRFTGWQDVDLTELGRAEARAAGLALKKEALEFDQTYSSVLTRAIRTHWIVLDEMEKLWLPVKREWRLNERHYGGLTGLDKAETAARHGEEQVKIWRRSYDTPPPPMTTEDPRHPSHDPRYREVPPKLLPQGESLKDTVARFLPLWNEELAPMIKSGKKILIVAHGNSLRALVQHLEGLSPEQIMEINIPTGIPFMYELDRDLKVLSKRYLGDPDAVKAAIEKAAGHGKKKA